MGAPAVIPLLIGSAAATTFVEFRSARDQRNIARQNAARSLQEASAEELRFRRSRRRELARARAQFGASGFDFSGSVFDVLADEAMEIEEDALFIRSGGFARASRFENEASAAQSRAIGSLLTGGLKLVTGINEEAFIT